MKSMTGYGKATVSRYDIDVDIEIKSINARYLDLKSYLPRDMSFFEFQLRKLITKSLSRGTIEVRVNYADHRDPEVKLNQPKLFRYNEIISQAMKLVGQDDRVPIELLIKEPGIIESKKNNEEDQELIEVLNECTELAISRLLICLENEGRDISKTLQRSIDQILESTSKVEELIVPYRDDLFVNMKKRINDILANVQSEVVEQRLIQELAIYIDRYDIHEEITRLRSHIDAFNSLLRSNGKEDIGKSLNFIMQEMQREANTLGSKFSTTASFKYILVIKEEVEKCREIIQNVA